MVHLNSLYPFGIFALHQKWFKKKPFIVSEHWTGYLNPQSQKIGTIEKYISKINNRVTKLQVLSAACAFHT